MEFKIPPNYSFTGERNVECLGSKGHQVLREFESEDSFPSPFCHVCFWGPPA